MALSEYEVDWIGRIKKSPVTDDVMAEATAKIARRESYINDVVKTVVANKRKVIDDAQNGLMIENEVTLDGLKGVWHAVTRQSGTETVKIPWRVTDADRKINKIRPDTDVRADLEVDTREDVGDRIDEDGYTTSETQAIPQDKLDKLTDAFAALNEVQNHMIAQVNDDGTRLFSDDDIRRELWTPMVREGLVPDNMVPDKFSEEAIAYAGAAQMYDEKLKDYTKKSTGNENLIRNLGIAQDVFALATAGVSLVVSSVNANQIAALRQDLLKLENADKIKDINAQILALTVPETATAMAGAVVTGGLGIAKTWVENEGKRATDDQWWVKAGEATAAILIDTVTKSVTAGIAIGGSTSKDNANIASGSIQAGLNGLRIGFAIYQVSQENDPAKRKQLLANIGMRVADVVGNSLQIYSAAILKQVDTMPKTNSAEKEAIAATRAYAAEITQISNGVTAGIRATANGPAIYDAISKGRYKEAAALLGGGAVQAVLTGTAQELRDLMMADTSKEDIATMSPQARLYAEDDGKPLDRKTVDIKDTNGAVTGNRPETDAEAAQRKIDSAVELSINAEARRSTDAAKVIADLEKAMGPLNKAAIAGTKAQSKLVLDQSLLDKIAKEVEAETLKAAETVTARALEEHFTEENVEKMFEEFGTKMKGYETFYNDANPVTALDGAPDDDVEKAMEAINRAIERTSELRMKAELINGVTAATAGVIAAVIPGAGAVAAAQAIAFDIYQLIKHVEKHNEWVRSMESSFRANSAYSAAIERTMINAEITMSKTSVKLVLDSLNLGAQVGRCFDPTGGATVAVGVLTMTQALVDFGYKMHKLSEISAAWDLYLDARANPGNRKRARKAIRGNSTLAKCAIAYGACIVGDPVAEDAILRSGLSPEILADDKDVCKQLIVYLENELPDDPSVMHVDKKAREWMPDARPLLTPVSWLQFKKAAHLSATPKLSKASLDTPAIDDLLSALSKAWGSKSSYVQAKAEKVKPPKVKVDENEVPLPTVNGLDAEALELFAEENETLLTKLVTALTAYKPMQDMIQTAHKDFGDVTKTMTQLAKLNLSTAKRDLQDAKKAILTYEDEVKKVIAAKNEKAAKDAAAKPKASEDKGKEKEELGA